CCLATHPIAPSSIRTFIHSSPAAMSVRRSPLRTCAIDAAVVDGSLRTFNVDAVTRTVPIATSPAGACGVAAGGGSGAGAGGGGAAHANARTTKATQQRIGRTVTEIV